jgi:hypothetical protein
MISSLLLLRGSRNPAEVPAEHRRDPDCPAPDQRGLFQVTILLVKIGAVKWSALLNGLALAISERYDLAHQRASANRPPRKKANVAGTDDCHGTNAAHDGIAS